MSLPASYKGPVDSIRSYWHLYGGFHAFVRSFYLHAALFISLISVSETRSSEWVNLVTTVIPCMLAFTLTAYAVIVGFGNDKFQYLLSRTKEESGHSSYMTVNSTFVGFIGFQLLALIYALVANAHPLKTWSHILHLRLVDLPMALAGSVHYVCWAFWFIGYWLFIYSILLGVAATFAVFRLAKIYDQLKLEFPPDLTPQNPNQNPQRATGASTTSEQPHILRKSPK